MIWISSAGRIRWVAGPEQAGGLPVVKLVEQTVLVFAQVVEDGYEFFAKRQLVTLFSAPNYCGEFDNAGAMMSVDESLMCSFQVSVGQEAARLPGSAPGT